MNDKAKKRLQLTIVFLETAIDKQANVCYSFHTTDRFEERDLRKDY